MKNAMQLKAIMKKLAKENQISAQLVLQNYMLERFLERVSLSPYRDNYIIKGGFLISSMVGLNSRATMDMDATIKGYPVTQDAVQKMIEQILTVPVDDDITFTFKSIGEIREGDEYTGYRVALTADFPPMAVPLKLDITTGDKITPREIQYDYKLMLEDRHIQVMAYNLATILAEKLETVISRSDQNTRPRDYYDVYILTKLQAENIDFPALGAALMATASKRGSDSILQDYRAIVEAVRNSEIMRRQWDNYRKDFDYASTISFDEVCDKPLMESHYTAPCPTIKDLWMALNNQRDKRSKEIALALRIFATGSMQAFAQPTNVDMSNRLICFNIQSLGEQLKPVAMLSMLEYINTAVMSNERNDPKAATWVYFDEIYLLLRDSLSANFLYTSWKRFRKYNAYATGITQNVQDCLTNDTAYAMLANSEFVVMLRQTKDIDSVVELYGLSEPQRKYLLLAQPGEGIIKMGNSLIPFNNPQPKDTKTYKLLTTKPGEME